MRPGVKAANHRGQVLAALETGAATARQLSERTGVELHHTRHILGDLLEVGVVRRTACAPSMGRGRSFRYEIAA